MADDRSPTLRRRELGRRLRDLRADRTIQEVADALGVSAPTISRIETGARTATRRNILALCELYGVDDSLRTQLLSLARQASEQGWWHKYDDLAIDPLIGLEIEAVRISSYEPCIVPWMFQTRQYARAVIRGTSPRMADNILEERVEARLIRQELLNREVPPHFWSIVDESALRRRVGSTEIMREQLNRMAQIAALPNMTLQIVPFSLGAHPGLKNPFTFLEFGPPQPPVVYVESTAGNLFLERISDLEGHEESLQHLRADALDPGSSLQLITDIEKTFKSLYLAFAVSPFNDTKEARMTNVVGSNPSSWRIAKISADSNCVQVRRDNGLVVVGNSRFPDGPFLSYTKDEWAAFLDGAKKGEFDEFTMPG